MPHAFRSLGHEVDLVGPVPLRPYDYASTGGRLRDLARRLPWWAKDFLELALQRRLLRLVKRALSRKRYDFVFHRASIYDLVGARLAKMAKAPVVAHLDAPFAVERAFHRMGYFARLHRRCMCRLGRSVHLVITVSPAAKDYYVRLGIPEEKLLVLPNGISSRLLAQGIEAAKDHPPLSDPGICTIGFVGSLSPWHRVDLLLRALAKLEDRFRATIVGCGAEYKGLRALAEKLGVAERVNWLGALPHEQAVGEIANFDIAVLPGTLPTGAPIKLFEYAAMARPTVAPDLPNLRTWFGEDEMCYIRPNDLAALAEAIRGLASAPERARAMGRKAQERVRAYTWESIAEKILAAVGLKAEGEGGS